MPGPRGSPRTAAYDRPPRPLSHSSAAVHSGARETPGDAVDESCDGVELCYRDEDLDGWRTGTAFPSRDVQCAALGLATASAPHGDCDDADPAVHPGASDPSGDGVDEDCNGRD